MAQRIVVQESTDTIKVVDKDTSVPVSVNQESVAVSGEKNTVSIKMQEDNTLLIEDSEETLSLQDITEIIRPQFAEVLKIIQQTQVQVPVTEEEMPYKEEIDFVGSTLIYRGWADPGIATSSALWRIRRTRFIGADEDVVHDWADGNSNFDNIWNDRATLSYN